MFASLKRVLSIPELKQKILFTLIALFICRIGVFIPVPGINGEAAERFFMMASRGGQNLFQLVDMFSGGAFRQMTVGALGVVPYITASIVMQMVVFILPGLQREVRENPQVGRKKIIKWTRILTVLLSVCHSFFFARYALSTNAANQGVVVDQILQATLFGAPFLFYLVVVAAMTTGTVFLMWLGEQITERGIGNGISLIITINILSQLPSTFGTILNKLNLDSQVPGEMSLATLIVLFVFFVLIIMSIVLLIQGQRRIPLQYARRVVGRRETQGGQSYIPLKLNYAGVIPVIFASSLLMFPATIAQFMGPGSWIGDFASRWFSPATTGYMVAFVLLIIAFTYFWTSTQFNPTQIASDMKKNGAFIPGIRQGKPTQEFLEATMNRITFIGAISLAAIAILPTIVGKIMNVDPSISYFFGGTPILILVGVVLDTLKQVESQMLMRRYDGLVRKGRVRGR